MQYDIEVNVVALDTSYVIMRMIFPASHVTGAKMVLKRNQTATKLQHKKPTQRTKHTQGTLNLTKLKLVHPGTGSISWMDKF